MRPSFRPFENANRILIIGLLAACTPKASPTSPNEEITCQSGNDFSGMDLRDEDMHQQLDYKGIPICNVDLSEANVSGDDFSGMMLVRANFSNVVAVEANFENAILVDGNFQGAELEGVKLQGADLRGVNLAEANLTKATMDDRTKIDQRTNFCGANTGGVRVLEGDNPDAVLELANALRTRPRTDCK